MKNLVTLFSALLLISSAFAPTQIIKAQSVGINFNSATPNGSAALDIDVTALGTKKGLLIPRVTLNDRTAGMATLVTPAQGLIVYQTDAVEGFYYNTSLTTTPNWIYISPGGAGWSLTGNTGTVSGTNFIGTTDGQPLVFKVNGFLSGYIDYQSNPGFVNTSFGYQALMANTNAGDNTAVGYQAMALQSYNNGGTAWNTDNVAVGDYALYSNQPTSLSNGLNNTAVGSQTLYSNTIGYYNTGLGKQALTSNSIGNFNTATGAIALFNNTIGNNNTAIGDEALYHNTTGSTTTALGYRSLYTQSFDNGGAAWDTYNVAVGSQALYSNQPTATFNGFSNTAIGTLSLYNNTTGSFNSALGTSSLNHNLNGFNNTAIGNYAMFSNINAADNIAVGYQAMNAESYNNPGGPWSSYNVAIGNQALLNDQPISTSTGYENTAVGYSALLTNTTGYRNTAIGWGADVSVNNLFNATAVGYNAKVGASNTIVLGNGAVNVGIGCSTPQYSLQVIGDIASSATIRGVNAYVTGAITACSDIRYKKNVTPLQNSLANLMKLQGVTYYWKTKEFPEKSFNEKKQIGVIAQELEKVYPELVMTDKDGYKSVDYSKITPVLIEAIKDQQKEISELTERLNKLEKLLTAQPAVNASEKKQ